MLIFQYLCINQLIQQKQHQNRRFPFEMSKCHFPHDNYTIILDNPTITNFNNTLRLIQTNQHICTNSILSFSCFDKQQNQQATHALLADDDEEDSLGVSLMQEKARQEEESDQANIKKKKSGCTCKKTNCIKMYCQCFSIGKMCTPDCACYGCYNHQEHQSILSKAKMQLKNRSLNNNRHAHKGCNCKKTNCQKKYCQCYNAGLACTEACNCCDCCNKQPHEKSSEEEGECKQNS